MVGSSASVVFGVGEVTDEGGTLLVDDCSPDTAGGPVTGGSSVCSTSFVSTFPLPFVGITDGRRVSAVDGASVLLALVVEGCWVDDAGDGDDEVVGVSTQCKENRPMHFMKLRNKPS
jgi:hypothetical protein